MKPIKARAAASVIYGGRAPWCTSPSTTTTCTSSPTAWDWSAMRPPRLTATGPVPYDAYDAGRPLETGMVISVETMRSTRSAASSSSRTRSWLPMPASTSTARWPFLRSWRTAVKAETGRPRLACVTPASRVAVARAWKAGAGRTSLARGRVCTRRQCREPDHTGRGSENSDVG